MPNEMERQNWQLTQQWIRLLDGSLEMGEIIELPVLSDSMLPVMGIGRNIRIQRNHWNACSTGDIIVFRERQKLTAHRLLFILRIGSKCYFFQKGDSNPCGHFIRSERVVGRVLECQNKNGSYVSLASRTARYRARIEAVRQALRALWEYASRLIGR